MLLLWMMIIMDIAVDDDEKVQFYYRRTIGAAKVAKSPLKFCLCTYYMYPRPVGVQNAEK